MTVLRHNSFYNAGCCVKEPVVLLFRTVLLVFKGEQALLTCTAREGNKYLLMNHISLMTHQKYSRK